MHRPWPHFWLPKLQLPSGKRLGMFSHVASPLPALPPDQLWLCSLTGPWSWSCINTLIALQSLTQADQSRALEHNDHQIISVWPSIPNCPHAVWNVWWPLNAFVWPFDIAALSITRFAWWWVSIPRPPFEGSRSRPDPSDSNSRALNCQLLGLLGQASMSSTCLRQSPFLPWFVLGQRAQTAN